MNSNENELYPMLILDGLLNSEAQVRILHPKKTTANFYFKAALDQVVGDCHYSIHFL